MKRKIRFENMISLSAIIITLIPLIISYSIFVSSKLSDIDENIRQTLKITGFTVAESDLIKTKLAERQNDFSIQDFTKEIIANINDVDLIVVGDMTGEKYSHLDESQIGQIYVNEDKKQVLETGDSYYSVMVGSMGKTLRWFEPIFYKNKQVGFVMVGKYYEEITVINSKVKTKYFLLFIFGVSIAIIASKIFAYKIRKSILNMEPEEIAMLYNQKNIIVNSVKDGIIALDKNKEVVDVNKSCFELFDEFDIDEVMGKIKKYIDNSKDIEMKEFIVLNQKIFITIKHIYQKDNYLGAVITLVDKNKINKIAKEITGVDEIIKSLRANIHEFKNNLHVIFGLIQLKEYEEATKYILNIQHIQRNSITKFKDIEDSYVNALLMSRELVAKERKIQFVLTEESFLFANHGIVDSYDIVTILGNLIENAFEACSMSEEINKTVEISLYENEELVEIQVRDNGIKIEEHIKDSMYKEGVSTKGTERGTGLYLVKNRVELYNGKIDIEEFNDEKIFVISMYKGVK